MESIYVDYMYVTTAKYLTSNDTCPPVAAGGADGLALWL